MIKIAKEEVLFFGIPLYFLIFISVFCFNFSTSLGIDVTITSLGIIFTTIWLNILLPRKEKKKWKIVEKKVKKNLANEIKNLYQVTIGYFTKSSIGGVFLPNEDLEDEKVWNRFSLEKMEEIAKRDKLEISSMGKHILEKGTPAVYIRYREEIDKIESKYFQFLKPGEIISLMKMQEFLKYLININKSAKIKNSFFQHPKEYYEEQLCEYSLKLYQEIFYFHTIYMNLFL